MRTLIACEESGIVRDAFIARGYDAISCDLLPTTRPGPHYQGDVRDILNDGFDLLIAHPVCKYLANSGARWLYSQPGRWEHLAAGVRFFKMFLDCDIPHKAIENPIIHKHAVERIGRPADQTIHPWQYGHMESKATCFWLENLPELKPTKNVKEEMLKLPKSQTHKVHRMAPGPEREKLRSRTLQGHADAYAEQWGGYVARLRRTA